MTKKHKKHDQQEQQEQQVDAEQKKQTEPQSEENLLERLQRVSADYLNYQKRAQRDIEQARIFANEQLIKDILPVLDDMERALAAARENHGEKNPLYTGMQMVHDKAIETLRRFGLAAITAEGDAFDPEQHSALMQQESDKVAPNTVLKEVQRGYTLKGRTIRPSGVIVSKAPEVDTGQPEIETEQQEN